MWAQAAPVAVLSAYAVRVFDSFGEGEDEKVKSGPRFWLLLAVAVPLFGLCGVASAAVFFNHFPEGSFPYPLPFAVLCGYFFQRRSTLFFLSIPLMAVTWYAAYVAAFCLGMDLPPGGGRVLAPCLLGGSIGGLGLLLSTAASFRRVLHPKFILFAVVTGSVAALAFAPSLSIYETNLNRGSVSTPLYAFGLWQACMGTLILAIAMRCPARELAN